MVAGDARAVLSSVGPVAILGLLLYEILVCAQEGVGELGREQHFTTHGRNSLILVSYSTG